MMKSAVVQRYAQAIFEESIREPQVHADMELIANTMADSRDLLLLLKSPIVPRARKSSVLEQLFGRHIDALTMRFVRLLINRRREALLPAITQRFSELSDEAAGRTRVDAQVAVSLSKDVENKLTKVLEDKLHRLVQLSVSENPDLLGGIVLRIGDTVYDGSVHHQLSLLRSRMHV